MLRLTPRSLGTKKPDLEISKLVAEAKRVKPMIVNIKNPANCLRVSADQHKFVNVGVPRIKGQCVNCLRKGVVGLKRIGTLCDTCPGKNWMCEPCFMELHKCNS